MAIGESKPSRMASSWSSRFSIAIHKNLGKGGGVEERDGKLGLIKDGNKKDKN